MSALPVSDAGLCTSEARIDPYAIHDEPRELGPGAFLSRLLPVPR